MQKLLVVAQIGLAGAADSRTAGPPDDPLCAQESLGAEETMQTTMQTLLPGRGAQGGGGSNGPLVKRQRTMDMADAAAMTVKTVSQPLTLRSFFVRMPPQIDAVTNAVKSTE